MDSDLLLAMKLQEEENKKQAKKPSEKLSSKSSSSDSIVSSQWEIYDPNPDIYTLFQVFNAKFFWNQLGCVEVKWSTRMYSCAGTTTYKGMRGCIVTLSLPLLKLRPRKDLVETLLHEMIHAYLFVADRNREREEHGPKFHSHMDRINKAAGTHITVYHSFHDEVRHYKTHWWRCNGPCQFKHPYYGLVKRSMNRAPGPNDFWFEEHRVTCGGEFIKVKEPDGFKSRKSKKVQAEKENSGKLQSLNTFFSSPQPSKHKSTPNTSAMNKLTGIGDNKANVEKFGKINKGSGIKGTSPKSGKQQNLDKFISPAKTTPTSNIGTMNNVKGTENNKASVEKFGKANNVHGFKGLSQPSGMKKPGRTGRSFGANGGGGTALLSNRGGTLMERPRAGPSSSFAKNETQQSPVSPKKPIQQKPIQAFSGKGQVLDPNCKPNEIDRANSRLLKLFPESNSSTNIENNPSKKPKLDIAGSISLLDDSDNEPFVNCPVCNIKLREDEVNDHLDECMNLEAITNYINGTVIIEDDDEEDEETASESGSLNVNCPICDYKCSTKTINSHLDECLQNA
ncbi:hypothetical protein O3M35_007808 [Rhynocoris fuscipes]|uniref:Protein with SprT-like domain at the N terminus n=1 Tax=Rhynocoris fuscipes TaxID=488301 RepID=A0AAW1DHY6_9HEMI